MDAVRLIRRLPQHRAWVNEKLLAAAAPLTEERLRQPFPIGQGVGVEDPVAYVRRGVRVAGGLARQRGRGRPGRLAWSVARQPTRRRWPHQLGTPTATLDGLEGPLGRLLGRANA